MHGHKAGLSYHTILTGEESSKVEVALWIEGRAPSASCFWKSVGDKVGHNVCGRSPNYYPIFVSRITNRESTGWSGSGRIGGSYCQIHLCILIRCLWKPSCNPRVSLHISLFLHRRQLYLISYMLASLTTTTWIIGGIRKVAVAGSCHQEALMFVSDQLRSRLKRRLRLHVNKQKKQYWKRLQKFSK
jgi:hypothetical protein